MSNACINSAECENPGFASRFTNIRLETVYKEIPNKPFRLARRVIFFSSEYSVLEDDDDDGGGGGGGSDAADPGAGGGAGFLSGKK